MKLPSKDEPPAKVQKPLKRLGKDTKPVKKKTKNESSTTSVIVQSEEDEDKPAVEEEENSEEGQGAAGAAETESPKAEKKNEPGEVKKTLKEMNAPKDKNPELEQRTLFVGNVPKESTKKQVMRLFKSLGGKIESLRFRCAAPDKPTRLKKVAINR